MAILLINFINFAFFKKLKKNLFFKNFINLKLINK